MKISICIICCNEESNISRCLESSKWADEIIVVDSMSQDRTVEIAREHTDKVYQRAWPDRNELQVMQDNKSRHGRDETRCPVKVRKGPNRKMAFGLKPERLPRLHC